MKTSPVVTLIIVAVLLMATTLLPGPIGHAHESSEQDADKSLDIERYPNEPLELVDLKVADVSVKDKIISKYRRDDYRIDHVTFKGEKGWIRSLLVRLRNVSGKPIYGVSALLYFQPPSTRIRFSLPLAASTEAKQGVLEPGGEITLAVSDQAWGLTARILREHGVDADLATVKFSIDGVGFSEDLHWRNGHLHRRDPNNPNKWNQIIHY